jgi:hypothetical protein
VVDTVLLVLFYIFEKMSPVTFTHGNLKCVSCYSCANEESSLIAGMIEVSWHHQKIIIIIILL